MRQFTDISILLDRSGSMSSIKDAMETAFDNFIKEHRAVPSTKITLVQFDDMNDQDVVYQGVPVESVERLKLKPRGNTPLLDAFCKLIDRTGERLSGMSESDRPDQVLMVIITDGQENSSHRHTRNDVFNRVTKQRESFKWQFVYLGANQDVFAEAASFGIPQNWALHYQPTRTGTTASSQAMSDNTVAYTSNSSKSRGTAVMDFNDDQRLAADDQTIGSNT